MRFVTVDVETANADRTSICQIGVALFGQDGIEGSWVSLVNPEDYFDSMNVSIHGITPEMVQDAPTVREVFPVVNELLEGQIVAHHMPFDRIALERVAMKYELPLVRARWLDTARIVRCTWKDRAVKGYGLKKVAGALGISFQHHDALEDAIACGKVLLSAIDESGVSLEAWLEKIEQPIGSAANAESVTGAGRGEGAFAGDCVVFTGTLSVPRREAAALAAACGCAVSRSVTRKTNVLVVGVQDLRRTGETGKSSKHRKAEDLIRAGYDIAILDEEDFHAMVAGKGGTRESP